MEAELARKSSRQKITLCATLTDSLWLAGSGTFPVEGLYN